MWCFTGAWCALNIYTRPASGIISTLLHHLPGSLQTKSIEVFIGETSVGATGHQRICIKSWKCWKEFSIVAILIWRLTLNKEGKKWKSYWERGCLLCGLLSEFINNSSLSPCSLHQRSPGQLSSAVQLHFTFPSRFWHCFLWKWLKTLIAFLHCKVQAAAKSAH